MSAVGGTTGGVSARAHPGKFPRNLFVTCIIAAMGGLIFGYDTGISGGVTSMDPFRKKFFPKVRSRMNPENCADDVNSFCHYDDEQLTLFTSSLYPAALASSLVASYVSSRFGLRRSMLFGGVLFLAGAFVNGFAQSFWMLIGGRIFLGFGIGFVTQSVPLYLSEMAPNKRRGELNIGFQLSITFGIMMANVLNYLFMYVSPNIAWRLSLGGGMVPALVIILSAFFLPDTPNFLIKRGEHEKAREMLKLARGILDVDDLVAATDESIRGARPWNNKKERRYRPQSTMAILIPFFQQFTGINMIMFYAPVLFSSIGFGDDASIVSVVITGIVNLVTTMVCMCVVDKWGRRTLFFIGGALMLVCQIAIIAFIIDEFSINGASGEITIWYAMLVMMLICTYVAGFALSWGPLGWLVPSEIFPLEVRSAGQSTNVSVSMLFTFIAAQMFAPMMCHLKFGLFIFYSFFVSLMTAFIYFFLPETKGVPIDQMSHIWTEHWFWSKYITADDFPAGPDVEIQSDVPEYDFPAGPDVEIQSDLPEYDYPAGPRFEIQSDVPEYYFSAGPHVQVQSDVPEYDIPDGPDVEIQSGVCEYDFPVGPHVEIQSDVSEYDFPAGPHIESQSDILEYDFPARHHVEFQSDVTRDDEDFSCLWGIYVVIVIIVVTILY